MKKILLIIISILMFCSCAATDAEKPGIDLYGLDYASEVPDLYVGIESWGTSDPAAKGGYDWEKDNGDGTMTNTIACGMHPLQMEDMPKYFTCGKEKINLIFDETMVSYEIVRYEIDSDYWVNGGYTGNEVPEPVETENDSFVVSGDGKTHIYVVTVNYKSGSCEYAFEINSGAVVVDLYKIVDGAESGNLVLAGSGSHDVMTLDANKVPVFLDGEPADASAIMDGMTAEIHHSGLILESYPGMFGEVEAIHVYSIGTKNEPGGTYFDLCGLYLKVLDDLWEVDTGLNGGAEMVSIDLSEAPGGITESEEAAIAWVFGNEHGVMVLNFTMDELIKEGYLTAAGGSKDLYKWDNGVYMQIYDNSVLDPIEDGNYPDASYSLPVLRFDAMKWRSPLGAYFFSGCTAVWPQMGTWTDYNIGAHAIS